MNTNWMIGGLVVVAVIVGGYFLAHRESATPEKASSAAEDKDSAVLENSVDMMKKGAMTKDEAMMGEHGTYEDYSADKLALATNGKVVLYFHATWCPICRSLDANISSNLNMIPAGVHILKVDYDTATALKQKYSVTYQHTFVQVDARGMMITKWGDSTSLAGIIAKIQ